MAEQITIDHVAFDVGYEALYVDGKLVLAQSSIPLREVFELITGKEVTRARHWFVTDEEQDVAPTIEAYGNAAILG